MIKILKWATEMNKTFINNSLQLSAGLYQHPVYTLDKGSPYRYLRHNFQYRAQTYRQQPKQITFWHFMENHYLSSPPSSWSIYLHYVYFIAYSIFLAVSCSGLLKLLKTVFFVNDTFHCIISDLHMYWGRTRVQIFVSWCTGCTSLWRARASTNSFFKC